MLSEDETVLTHKSCMRFAAGNVNTPVSYTHLDVYKRQVQYNPTVIFDEGTPEEVLIVKDGKVVCLGDK